MRGRTYAKGKCVGEMRLSGISGIHDVDIPGSTTPAPRGNRYQNDFKKGGTQVEEPEGGFEDESARLREWGMIP